MTRLTLASLAIAGVCYVMPAAAVEVGVGVGPAPAPGVTVHGDRDREKTVIEKRGSALESAAPAQSTSALWAR